jgi:hypothetical protein
MARRHQISAKIGDKDPTADKVASGAALMRRAASGLLGGLLLLRAP